MVENRRYFHDSSYSNVPSSKSNALSYKQSSGYFELKKRLFFQTFSPYLNDRAHKSYF